MTGLIYIEQVIRCIQKCISLMVRSPLQLTNIDEKYWHSRKENGSHTYLEAKFCGLWELTLIHSDKQPEFIEINSSITRIW